MKNFVTVALLIALTGTATEAVDFTVVEVVDVGPCYCNLSRPAQWSPDGTRLAYFADGGVMISDTLGNSHQVTQIEYAPHRFEWVSNDEIALFQRKIGDDRVVRDRLSTINIRTGDEIILHDNQTRMTLKRDAGRTTFHGPYRTIEGSAYYVEEQGENRTAKLIPGIQAGREEASATTHKEHIVHVGEDAVYLVSIDGADTTRISNKSYKPYGVLPMHVSPDRTHLMYGGTIVRMADDNIILLDTLAAVANKPEGTDGCGFGDESFNPVGPEVAFNLSCDDGHSYIVDRMGVFDYETLQFTIIDSLIGIDNCRRPVFSWDGRRMAFISGGNLFFLVREVQL